ARWAGASVPHLGAPAPPSASRFSTQPPAATVGTAGPVYLPNLPALRVEHNSVRVALGDALAAGGYGPFSIVNNHLATGGTVRTAGRSLDETVLLLSVSPSSECATLGGTL